MPKEPPEPFRSGGIGNMFVGEVIEVGKGITEFKVGDRVLGYGGFREVHTVDAGRCWKMNTSTSPRRSFALSWPNKTPGRTIKSS
jgi:NADPH:quinone reductase-like Zn-dependent oxidoreductase